MIKQAAELDALYEITMILARQAGQREMLEQILEILDARLGMTHGAVTLAGDGGVLVVETVSAGSGAPGVNGNGRSALAREKGSPGLIRVPIAVGHEVLGTLAVELPRRTPEELEREQRLLSVVAGLIAGDARNRRAARMDREIPQYESRPPIGNFKEETRLDEIVGNSRVMREVRKRIHQLADSDIPMLIRGEPGTGKELIATAIHFDSLRAGGALVRLSCAGLSGNALEGELFGNERAVYAIDSPRRIGRVEEAEGGTLFLDEVGDFSPALQVKLLRLIQDREYERAGNTATRKANVRVIAASSRDLEAAVQLGRFRQDLYYRLAVFPIHLPPLCERKDDVLLLADHFVEKYAAALGKAVRRISTPAIDMLMAYHWPGNVRELENAIEHAVLASSDEVLHGHNLPVTLQNPDGTEMTARTLKEQIHALERDAIVDALKRAGGSINLASRELGITGRMVRYKISQLGIDYKGLFSKRRR